MKHTLGKSLALLRSLDIAAHFILVIRFLLAWFFLLTYIILADLFLEIINDVIICFIRHHLLDQHELRKKTIAEDRRVGRMQADDP